MAAITLDRTPPDKETNKKGSPPRAGGRYGLKKQLSAATLRLHFYAGMFIGPFILVAALTGALYALTPTIEDYLYKDLTTVAKVEHPQPLKEQVSAAQNAYPDMAVSQVWPAESPTDSTRVLLADPSNAAGNPLAVFVDPGSSHILGAKHTYSSNGELPFRRWVSGLHEGLNLGDAGALYSELAASWLWVVALGGLYLWWVRVRARGGVKDVFRSLPAKKGTRRAAMNLHAVTGVWLLVAILGLSATGITWSNVAGENVNSVVTALDWKAKPIDTTLPNGAAGKASSTAGSTMGTAATRADTAEEVETVFATARKEGLTGPLMLRSPEDENSGWQAKERWVPWRLTSDTVSVNGHDGGVIDRLPFAELPLFSKLSSWGIYLHMGIMFGLPLQILLFLVGLGISLVVVQGYRMWWMRKTFPGVPNRFPWKAWAAMILCTGTVGVFLPLLGASLMGFLLLDVVLVMRRRKKAKSAAL